MMSLIDSELLIYHHNQQIKRDVEASRTPNWFKNGNRKSEYGFHYGYTRLVVQLTGFRERQKKIHPEVVENKQSLNSG